MKLGKLIRAVLLSVLGSLVVGCAGTGSGSAVLGPAALSSFVVWSEAETESATSARGEPLALVRVHGGEVIQIQTPNDQPVRVGERLRSGDGSVESWRIRAPAQGTLWVRTSAQAEALLLPNSAFLRVYRGHGSDPGYDWFALEDRVLDWAEGPLPAPFPTVAPAGRIDYEAFAALDQVLAAAVRPRSHDADIGAARAVRVVAGLRAVRALRPATGLPYFFDTNAEAPARVEAAFGALAGYALSPGQPLELPVAGPALLHIWVRSPVGTTDAVALDVLEGTHVRAHARISAPRSPLTSRDMAIPPTNPNTPIRRALVQVPPGRHQYSIRSGTAVLVAPLLAEPIVHVEQAARKDESRQLARARTACADRGSAPICALTLALLGLDGDEAQPAGAWSKALAQSSPETRALARDLADGGPRAPALEQETAGARGDAAALEALSRTASESVDEATRAAWVQAVSHGSEWRVAEEPSAGPGAAGGETAKWLSAGVDEASPPASCGANGLESATEIGQDEIEVPTSLWHATPTFELLVASSCADPRPLELVVDGEKLVANPAGPLARLRIRAVGELARIKRLDHSSARVLALARSSAECHSRWESLRAPVRAETNPSIGFDRAAAAVGVELWLRAGASLAELRVSAKTAVSSAERAVLVAKRAPGLTAYDAGGELWTRVARVALPPWATRGITVSGGANVAVRALVRVARTASRAPPLENANAPAASPPNEAAVTRATNDVLSGSPAERGPAYLRRALLLAAAGAKNAALADARAARHLGARGPNQEDAIDLVLAAMRSSPLAVAPLPESVHAFGIGPDFESGAQKCQPLKLGARAELEGLFSATMSARESGKMTDFDAELAGHALSLRERLPFDPRSELVLSQALRGSRWKLSRTFGEGRGHVRRARETHQDGFTDADGELRPRLAVGAPFAAGSYATVLPARPAKATLAALPRATHMRLDLACAAREAAAAIAGCPVVVKLGEHLLPVDMGEDGRASVVLPDPESRAASLMVSLRDEPGDWVLLTRLVLDRPAPEALQIDEAHWAIAPKSEELRTLLPAGSSLRLNAEKVTLVRVDARAEGETPAQLVVTTDHEQRVVSAGAAPLVIALFGRATLSAQGGALSVVVAERVPLDRPASVPELPLSRSAHARSIDLPLRVELVPDEDGSAHGWLQIARSSPPPLTPLQRSLGTLVAETGVVVGKLRQAPAPSGWDDSYAFTLLGYRRRVETLGLWTRAEVFTRARPGQPTYGAQGLLYEDLEKQHIRLTASVTAETQQVAGMPGRSLLSRGFVEYSYRALRDVFVLPRLGYDGMYSSIARQPTSLSYVDDEVFSAYRARRPTFVFAQALFWYAPYFNEIWYLRLRSTFDAKAAALSHSAGVIGAFYAFGDLDLAGEAQALWYLPRDSLSGNAQVIATTGAVARYSFWSGLGSLAVTPGISLAARPADGRWQVTLFVDLWASYRRGLRDFSSLELDFPEQLGGAIPWRGATPGGYQ